MSDNTDRIVELEKDIILLNTRNHAQVNRISDLENELGRLVSRNHELEYHAKTIVENANKWRDKFMEANHRASKLLDATLCAAKFGSTLAHEIEFQIANQMTIATNVKAV